MDIADIIQGGGLVIGGAALAKVADIAARWFAARNSRTTVEPTPLPVEKVDKYVTRGEFNKHVEDNARDHENLFGRLNRNDKLTSRLEGILEGIRDDLKAIKDKLFKTRS